MNFLKKVWEKLKAPHGVWLGVFYFGFVAVLAATLTLVIVSPEQTVWHYVLYVLAALGLTYFIYTMVIFAPKMKAMIINLLKKNKITRTMLSDYGYRTLVFGSFTFIINLAYVAFQGVLAIMSLSPWYISITFYYVILSSVKGIVFYSKRKLGNTLTQQAKTYRDCGVMFIVLTLVLMGLLVLLGTTDNGFEYAGLMIFVAATFTFYKLTLAIYNYFKARKSHDYYVQGIRNVNFASALVSLLTLQVAMIHAFSEGEKAGSGGMIGNIATGSVIVVIILTLGILMVIKANKTLKEQGKFEFMNDKFDLHAVAVTNNDGLKSQSNNNVDTKNVNLNSETKTETTKNIKQNKQKAKEENNEQKQRKQ